MNILLERGSLTLKQSTLKGKMEKVPSLSTSPLINKSCQAFRKIKANAVCKFCYSVNSLGIYKNLRKMLAVNTEILLEGLSDSEAGQVALNLSSPQSGLYRFESHGDLLCQKHLDGLCKVAMRRPDIKFALWTKRYKLAEDYFDSHDKPENLQLVYSSLILNAPIKKSHFKHCDKVFTVFDKLGSKKVTINCGGKKCAECRFCYTGTGPENGEINELIK